MPTARLLDADGHLIGADIIAAGYAGQIDYLSSDPNKSVNAAVFADHMRAGCQDAFVYEDGAADMTQLSEAMDHARVAQAILRSLGLSPYGIPVYFALDADVDPSLYPVAWANTRQVAIAGGMQPGVYGPQDYCAFCAANGCAWTFVAGGWRDPASTFTGTIQQTTEQVPVSSITCDVDLANAPDWGQWPRPAQSVPSFMEVLMGSPVSDPNFAVRYLYRFCLHREVDPGGMATYVAMLDNGASLDQVMSLIQDGDEGKAAIAAERKALGLP